MLGTSTVVDRRKRGKMKNALIERVKGLEMTSEFGCGFIPVIVEALAPVPDNIAALALAVKALVEEIDELKPGELGGQKVVNDLIELQETMLDAFGPGGES
jgi:hypothetical protein